MNRSIPIHKSPEEKTPGILGETLGGDNGIGYVKTNVDTRNIGWEKTVITSNPTASPEP